MPRNSTGMMIGLPMSVISIFSIGITGNSVRYSRVPLARLSGPASGVRREEDGERAGR
jgi:hypothetical protein